MMIRVAIRREMPAEAVEALPAAVADRLLAGLPEWVLLERLEKVVEVAAAVPEAARAAAAQRAALKAEAKAALAAARAAAVAAPHRGALKVFVEAALEGS